MVEIAGRLLLAETPDSAEFAGLAGALRAWEPTLGLEWAPAQGRLFEADGTLYALCLSPGATLDPDRRPRPAALGDLAVVPRAVALDLDPEADWLCLRDEGPPPPHFRERFIQVWAFEPFQAPAPGAGGLHPVIAEDDIRHAVSYRVADLDAGVGVVLAPGLDALILVGLSGTAWISAGGTPAALPPRAVALAGPGADVRVEGPGRVGVLTARAEPVRISRRRVEPSPEFRAGPGG